MGKTFQLNKVFMPCVNFHFSCVLYPTILKQHKHTHLELFFFSFIYRLKYFERKTEAEGIKTSAFYEQASVIYTDDYH